MSFTLSESFKKTAEELFTKYPRRDAALIPLLRELQRENGFISDEAIDAISAYIELPCSRVRGVVSFYTMFTRAPLGKYHLQVCKNISCHFAGARAILSHLEATLGIEAGQTTPDGLFTLSAAECLGSCGTAPVMAVNEQYFENLTTEGVDRIIENIKHGKFAS